MEDVGDLGGVGVAGEREPTSGEGELGGADGGDAEHGQVGGAPLVVDAGVAAVRLPGLLGGQIHRRHRWKCWVEEDRKWWTGGGDRDRRRGLWVFVMR